MGKKKDEESRTGITLVHCGSGAVCATALPTKATGWVDDGLLHCVVKSELGWLMISRGPPFPHPLVE